MASVNTLHEIQNTFTLAEEKAAKYEWTSAAEAYKQTLGKLDPATDPAKVADVQQLLARCHFKAAFQSDTRDQFKNSMKLSEQYEKEAAGHYEKAAQHVDANRSQARVFFARFWDVDELDQKRSFLEKCMSFADEATRALELSDDKSSLVESLRDVSLYEENAVYIASDRKHLIDHFEKAVEVAWRVIEDLQNFGDDLVQLETICVLVRLYSHAEGILEHARYDELEKKLAKVAPLVTSLAEKMGTANAVALADEAAAILAADVEGNVPKATGFVEQGVSKATETEDRYLLGRLYTFASAWIRFSGLTEEYADKRREQLEKALDYASKGMRYLQPSSVRIWMKYAYKRYMDISTYIALTVETDFEKKRVLLRKAIDTTKKGLTYDTPSFVPSMGHELSKAMYFLAAMETTGPEERSHLLKEALALREEALRNVSAFSPHSWNRGVMLNYLALLRAELSKAEGGTVRRAELLKQANSDMKQCIEICSASAGPPIGMARVLAQYNEWQGDILQELSEATQDPSTSRESITAYREAIAHLSKSGTTGPIPTVRWKIARCHDSQKEFAESLESFRQAAQEYRAAGAKVEPLRRIFEDFAQYMETWAIIEEARLNHEREQYAAAAEDYAKVAELLRKLKPWEYLSIHYSACSFLELGEAMSKQERYNTALESFNSAQKAFRNAGVELETRMATSIPSETKELDSWLEITRGRSKYTWGRSQLEEAKLLDSRMEEDASSAKYKAASEIFRSMLTETTRSDTRTELDTLGVICDAWAKMKTAETRASPELYAEAAQAFTLAETKATSKKTKLAQLANASMCKALEYGTMFRRTRDTQLYTEVKKNLETAADFYEEAGIKRTADWTRATQRLFDAMRYLHDAEIEIEARKRTEFFRLAENHFQLAAVIFGEAGFAKKKQEALHHLEWAREEKQLLMMPVEVLSESPTTSDVTISPMLLFEDKAAGLEKFRMPHLQGSLAVSANELHVGEKLEVDLEVVNIGKETATLGRIENLLTGNLEAVEEKGVYRIEHNKIDLRGKRIDHLKNYSVKLTLRARRKGTFEMKPRIVYFDDKGSIQTLELEPRTITVREIGVLGWIRGPQ